MNQRMFARGGGPLISILIPTRGRPDLLTAAMDSCYSLSCYKDLEFILKIDADDVPTQETAQRMIAGGLPVRTLITDRGRGYLDMPLWVSEMSRMAKGDWLFLFNDDARVETQDWDWKLAHFSPDELWHKCDDICLLTLETVGKPLNTEFLIVRRGVVEILGHWALSPHNDSWLVSVMRDVGSCIPYPLIQITHKNDEMTDQVRQDVLAVMPPGQGASAYNTVDNIRARIEDTRKLVDFIESRLR